ncbi:hypothetical protein BCR33DRAFT_770639 [Rhizoclosmatium globosum]|uniref:Uncharacterized protein n=1 Tax=Rhizoclosmatium globosum TaxID=329046 RepID=A0A1Y2BK71_9FUNG|nr:hypothetical protein BCR33DRAFT_770639 [Rhizoclosmatium globosum]|eukprot:ORY35164.1 hypothetical protein BCR33DRAFT_770639 [Rhizoclosmatium globosum]
MYMPTYPPMNGFVADENINKATHTADYLHRFIDSVPRQLVPHTEALAKNFVLFDRWFASVPGPTNPNRAMLQVDICRTWRERYHPPSPVSKGEAFVKQVYEAHGGFADHVPPPPAPKPGDGLPYNWKGGNGGASGIFEFDRYGVRVPTFLISPYVPAGLVQHGNDTGAQYDHTSSLSLLRLCGDFLH